MLAIAAALMSISVSAAADPVAGEGIMVQICGSCHSAAGVPRKRGAGVVNGVSGFGQISKIAARTRDVIGTLIQYRHLPVPGLALSGKDMANVIDYLKSIAPGR